MRLQRVYAAFAVILPVSLGLGLVYLSSSGRIDGMTAIGVTLAIVLVMGAGVLARDAADRRALNDGKD